MKEITTHVWRALTRLLPAIAGGALLAGTMTAGASTDYGPADWRPTCSGHWNTSGHGKRFYVEHDMEGYYASGVSYLQRCDISVSIHYAINSKKNATSDYAEGAMSQMVRDSYYAWHVRCWNGYTMGTEHEGFRNSPGWYTEGMYQASAALTRSKCDKFGIPKDRNHIVGHDEHQRSAWRSYASANLGIDPSCNDHNDPGPYWDWNHYMDLVRGTAGPATINPPYVFSSDAQGWTAGNGLAPLVWWGGDGWPGIIYNDQTGPDAFVYGPACNFAGNGSESINVSFFPQNGNTANHDMQFFWKTAQDNTWSASKASPMVNYSAQNGWMTIALDVDSSLWAGKTINQFRLDYDQNNSGTRWIVNHVLKQSKPAYYFGANTEGWTPGNGMSALTWTDCCSWPGIIYGDQTGNDAFLTKTLPANFRGARNDRIEVRVYPQGGTTVNHDMQVFWANTDENTFTAAKSTPMTYYAARDGWITLVFDVGSHPAWSDYTGKDITQLRLDFDQVNQGTRWIVDYIKVIHDTNPTANAINNAVASAITAPANVNAGSAFSATVTFTNVGTKTWTTDATPHKLGSQNPADNTTWGLSRVSLPGNVAPGQSVTFTINATAPATLGTLAFDWQMVEEGVQWFGPRAQTTITVTNSVGAAPSALAATAIAYDKVNLTWTDNTSSELGFKVERSTNGVNFTEIGTTAANVTAYADSGLSANTLYTYRVRAYNASGNSGYSANATATTPQRPPDLAPIGGFTGTEGSLLTFTASATNPNQLVSSTTWQDFEGYTDYSTDDIFMFRKPSNSGSTASFLDTSVTNYSKVATTFPATHAGAKVLRSSWNFKTGTTQPWMRLVTVGTVNMPNPTIDLDQVLRFDVYSDQPLAVGAGVRETGTSAAYGANGGTTGTLEWIGVNGMTSGSPNPTRTIPANTWTTLNFNVPFETATAYTGDGIVSSGKGVLEHLVFRTNGTLGNFNVYLDNFAVVTTNTLTYSLDAGAPAGASIQPKTGVFKWTPSAGQSGTFNITVRVTDRLGLQDSETISVSIVASGNHKPVLSAIGNKTVAEGTALAFTATATDQDAGQTVSFSLDAGAPSGASITTGGAFSWTPTEAQGPGSYPITVRVADNAVPSTNAFESITVTVNEVNVAPVLAAIADQTVNEGGTLSATASATDADVPANTLTYSLAAGAPVGLSIGSSSGAISWTTTEANGPATYPVSVIARDNGGLAATNTFNVVVNEVNSTPAITVNTTLTSFDPITDFEVFADNSYSGTVLLRHPAFSSTTSSFLDLAVTNYSIVTTNFPGGDNLSKALRTTWSFKTGTTNPWLRLSALNTVSLPNPTVNFNQHLRMRVYADKDIKIGLALRETDTGAVIGQNGGTTGTLEYVGVSSLTGSMPNPTKTVTAGSWTTVDFNIPAEAVTAFTGNGILTSTTGKGALETVAIVPLGGMGVYNVYFDQLEVMNVTTNLTVNTGTSISFAASATDADFPAQTLTYSLDAGAPAGATINAASGVFTWTPGSAQGPSTNVIGVRVTDNGPGNLSAAQNVTIVVNKVNTAPSLGGLPDDQGGFVEIQSGASIAFALTATDEDVPTNTLTFSLQGTIPPGATLNASSGAFSWTPPGTVASTNVLTFRVTDNGVPPLFDEKSVTIYVIPTNATPVLSLGTARMEEPVVTFETFTNNTPNEAVMFKKPYSSSTTTNYIDTTATNYTSVTTSFPAGNAAAGAKVLKVGWNFKTSATNHWVRLYTGNTTFVPNPTINASARLKLDVYTTKALKVGVGIRETGTAAENGANGGTTGNIEYVGVSSVVSGTPVPTRTVNANTWTTLEFDLPNEPVQSLTGNGILTGGQQVLEHLILKGEGGTGAYTVYLDNLQVVTIAALPSALSMKANSTLSFTASATDPDPGSGLDYGLDADAPTNAVINAASGAFTWTPTAAGAASITVFANDNPVNGAIAKTDAKTFTVTVTSDTLAPQSADGTFVAGGDTVTLTWDATAGTAYVIQTRAANGGEWTTVGTVTASEGTAGTAFTNSGSDSYYRVVAADGSAAE